MRNVSSGSGGLKRRARLLGLGLLASVPWAVFSCDPDVPSGPAAGSADTVDTVDSDRAVLVALYNATNGTEWEDNAEWLTDAPLGEWHGVDTNAAGRVVRLDLSMNGLSGRIPVEIGSLSALRFLSLAVNKLFGPIPLRLTELASLDSLNLRRNELTGPVPAELARISGLRLLRLGFNRFTGRMPVELAGLTSLEVLDLKRNKMEGPIPPELGNLSKLRILDLAGSGFSGPVPPELGQLVNLVILRLNDNRLDGTAPSELAGAGRLEILLVHGNDLTGLMPTATLGISGLIELRWDGRGDLCVPGTERFLTWLAPIERASGPVCGAEDILVLDILYSTLNGESWTSSRGWSDPGLPIDRHGVTTDTAGRVVSIDLSGNGLVGVLPDALGRLESLRVLRLNGNMLVGELPPTLGNLSELRTLHLAENLLSGPIPAELGRLAHLEDLNLMRQKSWISGSAGITGPLPDEMGDMASLRSLRLGYNKIDGAIPRTFGNLVQLEHMDISDNHLSGSIPSELGRMRSLKELRLQGNVVTGSLPPKLGQLTNLRGLYASANRLAGPVPPEFKALTSLEKLYLARNMDMAGPLSTELLSLRPDVLSLGGTGLCAPKHAAFLEWLANIPRSTVSLCEPEGETGSVAIAYLTQAIQSHSHPVPLIAGRKALLRVFLATGDRDDGQSNAKLAAWPSARATFFLDGAKVHATDPFSAESDFVPAEVAEYDISLSANIEVPAAIIRPGLTMTVDFDFAGADSSWLCCKRIPLEGRQRVDVRVAPPLHLTVLPMLYRPQPDSSVLDAAASMREGDSALLVDLRDLTPVERIVVEVREPVWTSSREQGSVYREVEAIRVAEGNRAGHHYLGLFNLPDQLVGLGAIPGWSSLSAPDPEVIAHEIMHNFDILHAPCGKATVDPGYPYVNGAIGSVGYEFRTGQLVDPATFDLMSNPFSSSCKPIWVSAYNFELALQYRLKTGSAPAARADGRGLASHGRRQGWSGTVSRQGLLLWGGRTSGGTPFLEPAFVVNAPALMPAENHGAYRAVGTAADGRLLFSFRFDMQEIADGDGEAGFAFVVPARPEWADALAALTLTGPGGSTTISQGDGATAVLLRDERTGQVRGILRDAGEEPELGPGLQLRVSRGIPSPASWRR